MARELIRGGLASGRKPSDFDQVQLRRGLRVELEHVVRRDKKPTARDRATAQEIAMDHLVEDPRYYDYLEVAETAMRAAKRTKKAPRRRNLQPRWRIGKVARSEIAKMEGVVTIAKVRDGVFDVDGEKWMDPVFSLPELLGINRGIICDRKRKACYVLDPETDDGVRAPTRAEMEWLLR